MAGESILMSHFSPSGERLQRIAADHRKEINALVEGAAVLSELGLADTV